MPTQAVARAIDLDDDGMMQQPVEQRGCDHGTAEDVAPFRKAAVRGEDHRALFVARIDQLEEQVAAAGYDREVTDLIDDQERGPAVEPEPLAQRGLSGFPCVGGHNGQEGVPLCPDAKNR